MPGMTCSMGICLRWTSLSGVDRAFCFWESSLCVSLWIL